MDDSPVYTDIDDDGDVAADRAPTSGTPRWVKASGIVALVVLLVLVVLLLTGNHGPGRHSSGGVTGNVQHA